MNILFMLLGLFTGLLCLNIYGLPLVFFPLVIIILLNIVKIRRVNVNIMFVYYILIIFSLIVSLRYNELFYTNIFSFSFIRLLVFIIICLTVKIKKEYFQNFLVGVKGTVLITIIWATFELIAWILFEFPWNQFIFGDILGIVVDHTWLNLRNNQIRVCGFSWDPLNAGILSALGFLLFENKFLKCYCLVILYFSGSRAAQLGLILCILISYLVNKMSYLTLQRFFKIFLIFGLCIMIFIYFFCFRIKNIDAKGDMRRRQYYISAIKSTVLDKNIDTFLFGGSPFYSGNLLARDKNLGEETFLEGEMYKINWKIESDWAHILTGRGWIGFLSYIIIFTLSYYKITDLKLKAILLLYFFSGIGYYYETSLFINLCLIYINQNIKLQWRKNERNNIVWWKWDKTLSSNESNIETNKCDI